MATYTYEQIEVFRRHTICENEHILAVAELLAIFDVETVDALQWDEIDLASGKIVLQQRSLQWTPSVHDFREIVTVINEVSLNDRALQSLRNLYDCGYHHRNRVVTDYYHAEHCKRFVDARLPECFHIEQCASDPLYYYQCEMYGYPDEDEDLDDYWES